MLCIHVVPFTKCHTNLPSGQREHIYCYYSSASDRGRDAGMDGYWEGERDRAGKAAEERDRGMDEWAERRQKERQVEW